MRVEPAPHVFRNEDRRQQMEERRGSGEDRRVDPERPAAGPGPAPHRKPLVWFDPSFVAHLIGQTTPRNVTAREARRAYQQPEAKTQPRPETVAEA